LSRSRFTIKNMMEVEDSVSAWAPGVEGRFARKHLNSEHLGVSYFRYDGNTRSPKAHNHRVQEELYAVRRRTPPVPRKARRGDEQREVARREEGRSSRRRCASRSCHQRRDGQARQLLVVPSARYSDVSIVALIGRLSALTGVLGRAR
jgi:hypothetical protein